MELNLDYLINKTSRRLHTAVRVLDNNLEVSSKVCLRMDLNDEMLWNDISSKEFIAKLLEESATTPRLFSVNKRFVYVSIALDSCLLVLGPIKFFSGYSLKNNYEISLGSDGMDVTKILEYISWDTLVDSVLDISNLAKKNNIAFEINENDIVKYNCISDNMDFLLRQDLEEKIFQQQETGSHHNPYDQEVRELSAIENGDIEALQKSIDEDYTGQLGVLADDKLRNIKNISIVVIAIASRAAIKGGLSPEIAFSMADLYINQIENITSENICLQITRNAEYEYTKIVHEIKEEHAAMNTFSGEENEHIMAAKNYIFKHLHGKIFVSEIADALGLNANYLSMLFKEKEGITLKDYILNSKTTLVKNLLTYSAYNYSEISYYLGFASQSHLGKVFKEKTGMTLSQYRAKYQMQEFLD